MSGRAVMTFRASKTIFREVFPSETISPVASMKSPAYTGALNSTMS